MAKQTPEGIWWSMINSDGETYTHGGKAKTSGNAGVGRRGTKANQPITPAQMRKYRATVRREAAQARKDIRAARRNKNNG